MNKIQRQFLVYAVNTFEYFSSKHSHDKILKYETALDKIYINLTIVPVQKAFRNRRISLDKIESIHSTNTCTFNRDG